MGLFFKKPNSIEQSEISTLIYNVQTSYRYMHDWCGVEIFVDCKKNVFDDINKLIKYESKYPSFFKHPTPSENKQKVISELPYVEKKYIDNLIVYIEKKLLNYSTDRGKRNNFNKEADKFRYYAGEFLPETVDYFNKVARKNFSDYIE